MKIGKITVLQFVKAVGQNTLKIRRDQGNQILIINPKVNLKVITMKVFINKLVRKRENVGKLGGII